MSELVYNLAAHAVVLLVMGMLFAMLGYILGGMD